MQPLSPSSAAKGEGCAPVHVEAHPGTSQWTLLAEALKDSTQWPRGCPSPMVLVSEEGVERRVPGHGGVTTWGQSTRGSEPGSEAHNQTMRLITDF